jgi:hypothetical protein
MFGDRMKTKMLVLVVGLASFVLGVIAASFSWGYAWTHRMVIPKEVDLAGQAGMDAVALAHLRLNEPKDAIQQLETRMDAVVYALAQWDEGIARPDEQTRKSRDRWLTSVKIYHESYPTSGDGAARINALLATVSGRNPQSTCKTSICRLDDLRLAKMNTDPNSATGKVEANVPANAASPPR